MGCLDRPCLIVASAIAVRHDLEGGAEQLSITGSLGHVAQQQGVLQAVIVVVTLVMDERFAAVGFGECAKCERIIRRTPLPGREQGERLIRVHERRIQRLCVHRCGGDIRALLHERAVAYGALGPLGKHHVAQAVDLVRLRVAGDRGHCKEDHCQDAAMEVMRVRAGGMHE